MKNIFGICVVLASAFLGTNAHANVDFVKLSCGDESTDFQVKFSKTWQGRFSATISEAGEWAGYSECSENTDGLIGYDQNDNVLLSCGESNRSAYGVVLLEVDGEYLANIHLMYPGFPYFDSVPCTLKR